MAKKKVDSNSLVKTKTLFDHLNHIREKKDPKYFDTLSEADKKTWSNYMICRFLSMQPELIDTVNDIQKYASLEPKYFYQCCIAVTPHGRAYFPYVKGKKDDTHSKELVDLLRMHYSESRRNVLEYLTILTKKEIRDIVTLYGYTEKEVEKIISS